jgi:hypothetical protein
MNPLARKSDLFAEQLPNEVVLYDKNSNKVHCLNKTAATVWENSDGSHTVEELAQIVGAKLGTAVDTNMVLLAVAELEKADLMETGSVEIPHPAVTSRREVVGKVALAGAALVATMMASAPAAHASGGVFSTGTVDKVKQLASKLPAKLVK